MKKLVAFFILTLTTMFVKAQIPSYTETPLQAFDTIYDNFGNKYNVNELEVRLDDEYAFKQVASTNTCQAGYFNVYFANGSGFDGPLDGPKRAVVCEVLANLSGMINSALSATSTKVNILVDNPAGILPSSAIAAASGFYQFATASSNPGFIKNTIEKTIQSGVNSYSNFAAPISVNGGAAYYHGVMFFGTSYTWHTTFSTTPTSGTYDLYTITLHEMLHALGFMSLIDYNGTSRLGSANPYYTTYDKFLTNSSGTPLLSASIPNCPNYLLTYAGSSTDVSPNGTVCAGANTNSTTCTQACKYISGSIPSGMNMKVYTPNCYEPGASLSHFEDMCYPTTNSANNDQYFVMANTYAGMKRYPKEEERNVLCDLGYSCVNQYTSSAILSTSLNTSFTYTSGNCSPAVNVWGVNDGINGTSYVWTGSSTSTITIPFSTLLANDSPGATLTCPTFAYNYPLTLNNTGTALQIIPWMGSGFCGPVVIQYLPKNGTTFGNITYVYAYIKCAGCNPPNMCNYVQNGGFETFSNGLACGGGTAYPLGSNLISCWRNCNSTPDPFNRNCTINNQYKTGHPTCLATYGMSNTHNGSPNNNAMGLAFSTQSLTNGGEVVKNDLSAPLVPTNTYVLSCWLFNTSYQNSTGDAVFSFATDINYSNIYPFGNTYPNGYNVIASFTLPASTANTWQFCSKTFTFNSPGSLQHSALLCGPDQLLTPLQPQPKPQGPYIIVDDISILPIGLYGYFTPPDPVCSANTLTNLAQYASALTGTFSGPGVTYNSSTSQYDFNSPPTLTPGVYGVSFNYTTTSGCTQTTWATINVGGIVTATNANTCSNGTYTLSATGFSAGTTYTWLPGGQTSASITVTPGSTTIYTLSVTVGTVCTKTYTTQIVVGTPSINPIPAICPGGTSNMLQSYCAPGTPTTGVFTGPNILNLNCGGYLCSYIDLSTSTPTPGIYTYTYTIYPNPSIGIYCTTATTFNVQYLTGFTITASALNIMCTNVPGYTSTITAQATPSTGVTYAWQPGPLLGQTQTVNSSSGTNFTVTGYDGQCSYSATLALQTSSVCCTNTGVAIFSGSTIPSGLIAGPIIINNDLTLPVGAACSFSGEVIFAPTVKITVQNGANMGVNDAHFYSCATTMWKGIVVQDGGKINCSRSLIEDAETAIDITGHSTSTITVPNFILDVNDVTFNKNFIAINIENYVRSTNNYPFFVRNTVFTSRTFTFNSTTWPSSSITDLRSAPSGTATFTAPYTLQNAAISVCKNPYSARSASVGIVIKNSGWSSGGNYYGVEIGENGTAANFNLFDALFYGINGLNSVISSVNNVYQNTQGYKPCVKTCAYIGGTGILSAVDNNFNVSLNLKATGTNSTSPSLGNRFWDCHRGVEMKNVFNFNCNYATFRSNQTYSNVSASTFSPGNVGISANTNRFQYTINNSAFNNINTAINIPLSIGTYTWASNTYTGVLADNLFITNNFFGPLIGTGGSTGTNYLGQAVYLTCPLTGTWTNIAGLGLNVASNTVNRAYRGIYINGYNAPAFVQTNTITLIDDQTYYGWEHGVRVENNSAMSVLTNSVSHANNTNNLVSLIYSGSNSGLGVTCNTITNGYTGFQFDGPHGGTNVWKGNKMSGQVNGFNLTNSGSIGTQGAVGAPMDNQWMGNWNAANQTTVDLSSNGINSKLYTKAGGVYQPTTNAGPVSQNYNTGGYTIVTTGTYNCGGGGGGGGGSARYAHPLSSPTSDENQPYFNNRMVSNLTDAQYISLTNNYRYLMTHDSIRNSDTTNINFCNTLTGTSIDKFLQAEARFYVGEVIAGQTLASAVTPTNDIEVNYQSYYNWYVKYANNIFTDSDSTALFNFALKCPGLEGSCVYQARALFNSIYNNSYVFSDNCMGIAERKKRDNNIAANIEWDVTLYPNPASKSVNVISSIPNEYLTITIKDVNGRILSIQNLITRNFIGKLDLNLIGGLYLVTIKSMTNETIVKKLVVTD